MSQPIIEISGLGKKYRIGANRGKYLSLREELARTAHGVLRRFAATHHPVPSQEDFWALKNVSFSVQEGEAVGIIGRNGAGKSTLLKVLSQITPPTEGKLTLRGRVASLLEVGTGFHPELTGRENVFLNGAILGMRREEIRRKFDEIVAFAEVEKFLDTPVKRYSSGMYVRLAFAVAAHLEPEILIIDEVLAVGDAQFQKKCLGKMGDVAKQGRTVLFVSHNMAAIRVLCQRGVLLHAGRVAAAGPIDQCIESYLGNQHSGDTIISHIVTCDPHVRVDAVRLNGTETDLLDLCPDADVLEVEVEGVLSESLVCELEVRLFDMQGVPLAIFSPGHEKGLNQPRASGKFCIRHAISLPRLTKGLYAVNLYLTNPGKAGWVNIPSAAVISAEASATPTGVVFEHRAGNGWIWLKEDSRSCSHE
jgi:lipopolysaccharide transport system ATP-binding protein